MSDDSKPEIGKIGWTDLTVDNADEIRDFYTTVVGWKPSPVDMGEYSDYSMVTPDAGEPKELRWSGSLLRHPGSGRGRCRPVYACRVIPRGVVLGKKNRDPAGPGGQKGKEGGQLWRGVARFGLREPKNFFPTRRDL